MVYSMCLLFQDWSMGVDMFLDVLWEGPVGWGVVSKILE